MRIIKLIGLTLLSISLILIAERALFISRAQSTEGIVVTVNGAVALNTFSYTSKLLGIAASNIIYFPTIQYAVKDNNYTIDGSTFVAWLNLSHQQFFPSQKVNVLYDSKNPANALINTPLEIWTLPCLLLANALVFLILIPLALNTLIQALTQRERR